MISTGAGADALNGGDGGDILIGGAGNDALIGGPGDDQFTGGAGAADRVDYSSAPSGISASLAVGEATGEGTDTLGGIENVTGSGQSDELAGDGQPNTIAGGGGPDFVDGGAGADVLQGGGQPGDTVGYAESGGVIASLTAGGATTLTGIDSLTGFSDVVGSGAGDILVGDGGSNKLEGGGGDDLLEGRLGDDVYDGEGGADTASFTGSAIGVDVDLGAANPQATGDGSDTFLAVEDLSGSPQGDVLAGDGSPNVLSGGGGADELDGNGGADTASYLSAPAGVTASLAAGTASDDGEGTSDIIAEVESLIGSAHADTLTVAGAPSTLDARGGADLLQLRNSNPDVADCGPGTDRVNVDGAETNLSGCERFDGPGPTGAAEITDSDPGSGSDENNPRIEGTAPGGSIVSLFTSADCSGAPLATGTATEFVGAGIPIAVADDSITAVYAQASDGDVDGPSGCSAAFTYVERTTGEEPEDPNPPDVTPPDTGIAKFLRVTTDKTPTYEFSSTQQGSTFQCKVDKGDYASCGSPHTLKKLKKGRHTFSVRATDAAGNTDATPAEDRFTVKKKKTRPHA